jgi:flagellar hook-associated protein 1 FlgK
MNEFFNAYQELAKDPSSSAVRALVREKGVTLSKYFNNTANRFESLQSDINDQVKIDVDQVNSLASQIQQLNKQIYNSELDGNSANDLRDSRTLLVDKLSKLINIQASEVCYGKLPNGKDDTHFVITVSGKPLVDHFNSSKLVVKQRKDKFNAEDTGNLYDISWEDGNALNLKGGELKGLIDVRDGNDGQINVEKRQTALYIKVCHIIKKN